MSTAPLRNPGSESFPSANVAGRGAFEWSCLALAVVFLSLLTWLINDARVQARHVHEELLRIREEIDRTKPILTLEGEVDPLAHSDKAPEFIGINYHPRFASPPRLTFPDGHSGWKITIQKADSFGLNKDTLGFGKTHKFKWKAEGQPAKTKLEEENEAIRLALKDLLTEMRQQGSARGSENAAIQREIQLLRELEKKRLDPGK